MDPLVPFLISFLIVFVHIVGEKLSERIERFHLSFLSLAAGLMVGALFLELLPKISVGETYLGGFIYVVFLAGFVGVHDLFEIQRRFGRVTERLITEKLAVEDFRRAFLPGETIIKAVVCFK